MEPEETKPCRFCRSMVSVNAIKCPFCNEILHAGYREHLASMQSEKRDSSRDGTAAILSLFVPGMGHIIKGYAGNGVLWFGALDYPSMLRRLASVDHVALAMGLAGRSSLQN